MNTPDEGKPERRLVRVQLDLPQEQVQQLDRLVEEAGLGTRKDLFNNALALMNWAVRELRRGRAIASVDEQAERFTELQMPFFSALSQSQEPTPKKK